MFLLNFFRNRTETSFKVSQSDRHTFVEQVIDSSAPKFDFYFLLILSTLIVSLGLISSNLILVLGGMLVTPLLSPILAISLGLIVRNTKATVRSLRIFFISFGLALFLSFITGLFFEFNLMKLDLVEMMKPSWSVFVIALIAGVAASYAWAKPNLNTTMPGVAITVTLIPPLSASGLAVSQGDWILFQNALNVLFINIFGIILASMFIFYLLDFYKVKKKVIAEVKEEEKEIKKEGIFAK